jgi:hypothetical protein
MGSCNTKEQVDEICENTPNAKEQLLVETYEGVNATVFMFFHVTEHGERYIKNEANDVIFCTKGTKLQDIIKNRIDLTCNCNKQNCICHLPKTD